MKTTAVLAAIGALSFSGTARAQGRGGVDWTTAGNDAQRSSWIRTDAKISPISMQKPGFQFLWKLKFANEARQSNSITPPALLDRYIGYRGFRSLGFIAGSSNAAFGVDTDLGRLEWERRLGPAPAPSGTSACPGGMTAAVTRPTSAAIATAPAGFGGGFGRGGPAKSGVGEPYQGAITLSQAGAPRGGRGPAGAPGAPGPPGGRGGPGAIPVGFGGFGRTPSLAYALSGDGSLYALYVSNGEDSQPPVRFLPANANAHGLIVVDNVAYAATSGSCGGADNGVWALDLATKQVVSWKAAGDVAGASGTAVGPDGVLYVATTQGELAALEPKTLKLKDSHKSTQGFASTPVVFEHKTKTLLAVAAGDGSIHLFDAASLVKPVHRSAANPDLGSPGALASWEDIGGTRWLMAAGRNAIHAWKLVERDGAPALDAGWTSREIVAPLPPMVMNGVVFAVSSGENPTSQRARRAARAVLYALDAATGKEFWSSGATITSIARGGVSGGGSQVYVATHDSTLYAFGMPIEH
jgi:outer membrane protein assembly factor BamB